jgi:hypothetical protein
VNRVETWVYAGVRRFYRILILAFVLAFIELDVRKVVSMELPRGAGSHGIDPVLDVLREHFQAQFLLLPFYLVIIFLPMAGFIWRICHRNRWWLMPLMLVLGFSYFITLEANIGILLYWYRPGYLEVAFSMTLMPLALMSFFTMDARRIIRIFVG